MTKQVTLENTLPGGLGLPGGLIVPGSASIAVEPEIWDAAKGHPVIKARVDAGTLIVDGQGKKAAEPSADVATLQARITELEGLLKAANDEIATLKAGNGGQGNGGTPGAYAVTDKGRGWFAVTQDGKEVTKSLREDDVKDFDGLTDEDKAAFVELHKPE